jgi:hypothetical protein
MDGGNGRNAGAICTKPVEGFLGFRIAWISIEMAAQRPVY